MFRNLLSIKSDKKNGMLMCLVINIILMVIIYMAGYFHFKIPDASDSDIMNCHIYE